MKDAGTNPELYELARPIPKDLIHPPAPGKYGDYVPHYVVGQVLLATVGPFDWELVEVLRGSSTGTVKGKEIVAQNVIVGAVYRLTVEVDGRKTVIEEVGEVDAYKEPTDGARLKKASSDALKRAAMRLGVALHLWTKNPREFFLPKVLRDQEEAKKALETEEVVVGGEEVEPDERPGAPETKQEAPPADPSPVPDEEDPSRPFEDSEPRRTPQVGRPADQAPKNEEEAIENLKLGGLVDLEDGEIILPTEKVVSRPKDDHAWTVLGKKEFVAYTGDKDAGASLWTALARVALEDRGLDNVDDVPDAEVLKMDFTETEVLMMLRELVA